MATKQLRGIMLLVVSQSLRKAQKAERADLASRLRVPAEKVRIIGVERRRFEAKSLG